MEVLLHLTAGTFAGMASVMLDYPLDTIKTRMQVYGGTLYRSYPACAASMFRYGGIFIFYRGLTVPLAAQAMENAVIFSAYHTTLSYLQGERRRVQSGDRHQSSLQATSPPVWQSSAHWTAAAAAGLAVTFVLTPVEMVKCNMQVQQATRCPRSAGSVSVGALVGRLWAEEGVRGFCTGAVGTATRAVLGNLVYFLSYEQLKQWLTEEDPPRVGGTGAAPIWPSMLAGGLSGCAYWTIAYPADVVKTRMQVQGRGCRRGFYSSLCQLHRSGGCRALYSGYGITAVRACISSSIVFTLYEWCHAQLLLRHSGRAASPSQRFSSQT